MRKAIRSTPSELNARNAGGCRADGRHDNQAGFTNEGDLFNVTFNSPNKEITPKKEKVGVAESEWSLLHLTDSHSCRCGILFPRNRNSSGVRLSGTDGSGNPFWLYRGRAISIERECDPKFDG